MTINKRYSYDQQMANYKGRPPSVEYQRFSSDFFTGSDVRIYFGDTWVDDVTGLAFNVQETVQPIYGYASFTYDAIARGTRQVQGQFSINFKESYYLHSVMNRLEQKMKEQEESGFAAQSGDGVYGFYNDKITVDHLMSSVTDNSSFEKYATMYEKALWGAEGSESMRTLVNKRQSTSFFAPDSKGHIQKNGFTIMVLYGPEPGLKEMYASGKEDISRTAHSLTGVHITGVSQQIDSSGQPLQEIYTFIAQDIDWNINLDRN
jgi:hypothetical protein